MAELQRLAEAAEMWLEAGKSEASAKRYPVAFETLRTAAEIAAKALLYKAKGSYPHAHDVSGPLMEAGAIPAGVTAKDLHKFLSRFTVGAYGFDETIHARDVQAAIRMAERMVAALRSL